MAIQELYLKNKGKEIVVRHYGSDIVMLICGYATIYDIELLIAAPQERCANWKTINRYDFIDKEYPKSEFGYVYLSGAILKELEK